MDAISSPDARSTDRILSQIIDRELPAANRAAYAALWLVYMGPGSDLTLPRQWAQSTDPRDKKLNALLNEAFTFTLKRCRRHVLSWPDPQDAQSYADEMAKKRRVARYTYFRARKAGVKPGPARRMAMNEARVSQRSVYYWTQEGRRRNALKPKRQQEKPGKEDHSWK